MMKQKACTLLACSTEIPSNLENEKSCIDKKKPVENFQEVDIIGEDRIKLIVSKVKKIIDGLCDKYFQNVTSQLLKRSRVNTKADLGIFEKHLDTVTFFVSTKEVINNIIEKGADHISLKPIDTKQVKNNLDKMRKMIMTLRNSIDRAYKTVVKVSNENVDLKELLKEREDQLNVSLSQIDVIMHERDSARKKLEQAEFQNKVTLDELKTACHRFKSACNDRQSLLEENLVLKGTRNEANNLCSNLDEENIKLHSMLKSVQNELNQVFSDLNDQIQKTNTCSTELCNLENNYECLQRELATLKREFQDQRRELNIKTKENEEMKIMIQNKEQEHAKLRRAIKSNEFFNKDLEDQLYQNLSDNQKLKNDLMAKKQKENEYRENLKEYVEKIQYATQEKLDVEKHLQDTEEKLKNLQNIYDKAIAKYRDIDNLNKCLASNFKKLFDTYSKYRSKLLKQSKVDFKDANSSFDNLFKVLQMESPDIKIPDQLENCLISIAREFELSFDAISEHIVSSEHKNKAYVNFIHHLSKLLMGKNESDVNNVKIGELVIILLFSLHLKNLDIFHF